MDLYAPIVDASYIDAARAKKLAKLKIFTLKDLLYHFPARYDDFSAHHAIADLAAGTAATVTATVTDVQTVRTWKRNLLLTTATVEDASGILRALWFNQRHIAQQLSKGSAVRLSGSIKSDKKGLYMSAPSLERATREPTNTGRLVPIYPETAGITSKWLRWQVRRVLDAQTTLPDPLPEETCAQYGFPPLREALMRMHFPETPEDYAVAQGRFAFEEMLILQCAQFHVRSKIAAQKAPMLPFDKDSTTALVKSLPFTLTDAQRKASFQVLTDLEGERPMNRLINGDVGSGKTMVAILAAHQTARAGAQTVILAPTEVLAQQHFNTLTTFLADESCTVALLTRSHKKYAEHPSLVQDTTRPKLCARIKSGQAQVIIGTHALLQDDVVFDHLALVVVDEQHRFGVAQRARMSEKVLTIDDGSTRTAPHLLTMTATPIPRTFALALFGDLAVSVLDEKPSHQQVITTHIAATAAAKQDAYSHIDAEVRAGRQAYIILPLVEESELLAHVKAATAEQERLQKDVFAKHTVGLLHGKLAAKEKARVMHDFQNGTIDILVATAVVEVGVDVPNATCMIIENAERFGLAQLHQFRGRIGRGTHASTCYLFSAATDNQRLAAMTQHTDGFALAEIDLDLRGPGEFLGTQQSGIPDGAMKNITNIKLVAAARDTAKTIIQKDPSLANHEALRKAFVHFTTHTHLA